MDNRGATQGFFIKMKGRAIRSNASVLASLGILLFLFITTAVVVPKLTTGVL
jgi:hypothetical protein